MPPVGHPSKSIHPQPCLATRYAVHLLSVLCTCVRPCVPAIPQPPTSIPLPTFRAVLQVSQEQVGNQLAALTSFTADSNTTKATPSQTLAMAARLAAVSSVSNSTSAETKAAIATLASSLLISLVSTSTAGGSAPASATDTAARFSGMNTMLSMTSSATDASRAAIMAGASQMAQALSSKPISVEDAGPIVDFFSSMLDDTTALVVSAAASAGGGGSASQAVADGAKSVLASLMRGTAALTQGLLNGTPSNGTIVQISTAKLAAAVRKASAALAAAGVTMQIAPPPAASGAASAGRRLLQSAASTVSASLNPAIGSLCAADPDCCASGLGVQLTVIRDTSLLLTSLGGSAAPLAANTSDYRRAGGAASIVSQIVRVAASGLPASAVGTGSLVVLDLPVNLTAVTAGPANSKRVILRLQVRGVSVERRWSRAGTYNAFWAV